MKKLTKAELIKVFTKIPNDFVDDFYETLKGSAIDDFPIDLDLVCKWLKVQKISIRRTLVTSYKKGTDYTENILPKEQRHQGRGGSNNLQIMMTIDCFKRLCMRSKTKVSELVRSYFIELDDFITHYSDQISDGIMNDIENVAKNAKNNPKDGPGYIYVIRVAKGLIKLGYAKDLLKRLSVYNTGRVDDVEMLYAFRTESRKQVEGCIKGLLEAKRFRKHREIYEADLDVIKKLINGCDKMSLEILGKKTNSNQDGKYYMIFMKKNGGYKFDN